MNDDSIEKLLKSTLTVFGIPVYQSVYPGDEYEKASPTEYIVFNYDTVPVCYGDNEPEYDLYLVQVHLFAKLDVNIRRRLAEIKIALVQAGFDYPSTEDASNEDASNAGWRHKVLETVISDGVIMSQDED